LDCFDVGSVRSDRDGLSATELIALTTAGSRAGILRVRDGHVAPSAARRFAIAAPMPREPPVTSATLFVNYFIALNS